MAKFDWVPYLKGKYLSYYQWFGLLGSTVCLALSFISFMLYLLLCKIGTVKQGYQGKSQTTKNGKVIEKLKGIMFNAGFVWLSLIPLICSALDIIYLVAGMVGMAAIFTVQVFMDNGRKLWDRKQNFLSYNGVNRLSIINDYVKCCLQVNKSVKKKLIIYLIISVLVNFFAYKTCLCFYNFQIGYYNSSLGFGINTCLTRYFQLKPSCPPGPPCQIYTTIPQSPSSSFFLNLHVHTSVTQIDVYYQQLHTTNITHFQKVSAQLFQYKGLQHNAQRNVFTALVTGLKPTTQYLIKVWYDGRFWTNPIYKTLPAPGDKKTPVRMINAGDSGYTEAAVNLSKIVATLKPDIFFIGGDIAYDDNMPACAYTWDHFLGMYGRMTATLGYLMPIVASVGNHDVGLNELPGINITVSNYGPAFHIYFPQHFHRNLDGHILEKVPPLKDRRTIFNYTFGNVHYLALDSGYMHGFDGWQKKFMIQSFQANLEKLKFVNYHVPIYSVCQNFDSDPTRFLYALFHWVPNFDKYHVMTVYQNHVHSFKRTKPLVGSNPKEFGTVYVGDGAYGAIVSEFCKPDVTVDVFQTFSKRNNFWLTQVTESKVQHWAYDAQGKIIDYFVQYPENYTIKINQHQEHNDITMEKAQQIYQAFYVKNQSKLQIGVQKLMEIKQVAEN